MIKVILRWIGQQERSHAILALNINPSVSFILQRSSSSSWSPRVSDRLDVIIKHHTSIHIIIHEANNRSILEQYTKHKIKIKSLYNESTSHYEHTDAKSTLIGATVKKIHLPKDLLIKLLASYKTYIRYCIEIII